jgi:lysine-specific demethylase 3
MGKVTNDKCTGFSDTKFTDFQQVYLLVHTSEVKLKDWQRTKVEMMEKTYKESEVKESHGDPNICSRGISPDSSLCTKINGLDLESDQKDSTMDHGFEVYSSAGGNMVNCEITSRQNGDVSKIPHPGVLWDVFRRQDVPKVTEYLKMHWKEFGNSDDIVSEFVSLTK